MTSPGELTQTQVQMMLIEKHQKFLENYTRKLDILRKLYVLNEKQEQLKYWIDSINNDEEDPNYQKYITEKKLTDNELAKLKNELKEFQHDGILNENKVSWLEQKISLHKEAMDYWNKKNSQSEFLCPISQKADSGNKYKEFVAIGRKSDERKGTERKDKRPKARNRQKK